MSNRTVLLFWALFFIIWYFSPSTNDNDLSSQSLLEFYQKSLLELNNSTAINTQLQHKLYDLFANATNGKNITGSFVGPFKFDATSEWKQTV